MELTKMRTSHSQQENDQISVLYEASKSGNVSTFNLLIQQHQLILSKVSQTVISETPLHISASLGHLEFTKALLTHSPKLALELNYSRSSALHLASAEGHTNIVKELLKVNNQPCLFPDDEGRIPLHYAAMRGRTEVVQQLIKAKPESVSFRDNGKTVFHLCVTYNHLETLKALVQLELAITGDLLNFTSPDGTGNTVLNLAIMLKQVETVRYLLSIPKVIGATSLEYGMGFTHHTKDFQSLEIQLMLINAGIKTTVKSQMVETPPQPLVSTTIPEEKGCWKKVSRFMAQELNGDWLDDMRGNLSLVATVISTITFQALINPPGGFVQQGIASDSKDEDPFKCYNNGTECPGDAVSAIRYPHYFRPYLRFNTICFIASLSVALLLVSGVPLKHRVVMSMLSIGMCITLTFLALTYIEALYLVTPDGDLFKSARKYVKVSLHIWIGFLVVAAAFITLCSFVWLADKCKKKFKPRPRIGNGNNI